MPHFVISIEGLRAEACEEACAYLTQALVRLKCLSVHVMYPHDDIDTALSAQYALSPRSRYLTQMLDFHQYEHRVSKFAQECQYVDGLILVSYYRLGSTFQLHGPRCSHVFYVTGCPSNALDEERFRVFCEKHALRSSMVRGGEDGHIMAYGMVGDLLPVMSPMMMLRGGDEEEEEGGGGILLSPERTAESDDVEWADADV